jgi:alanine racemase
MTDRLTAHVDLAAFEHNVRHLAGLVSPSQVMVAVKADAYGHGMVPLALSAVRAGASSLAVLEIPAGLALREAGVSVPLFAWLHGLRSDFAAAAAADLDLGISAPWQLDAIRAQVSGSGVRVHLKVDTGLSRNGATREDWPALVSAALEAERSGAVSIAAIWSHLADASAADDAAALARLLDAVSVAHDLGLEAPLVHLAASSAGIRMPEARLDLVRFGIAAYGVSPFDDVDGTGLGVRPVLSLTSVLLENGRVPGGFADGILPAAAGEAWVTIDGERCAVLAIETDTMTVDAPSGRPGAEVHVLGGIGPTAEQWAAWAGTIGDEVLTGVASRVPRHYS